MPVRKVSDPSVLQQLNSGGNVVAPNPMFPGQLQGQSLQNTRTSQEIRQAEATAGATTTKTRNEAIKSGIDIQAARADLNAKTGTPPGNLNKTGEEYLASLPPGVGDLTREMLAGKFKGAITSSRNPVVMQAALAAAHATKGNFDAGVYDERLALIKSITNPNSQLGALNTALAHAGHLYDQTPSVSGTDFFGHSPLSTAANAASNWWNSGSPAVTAYESTLQKYAPESARAYGVATGAERQDAQKPLNINLPLDAKQASLKNDMELFAGKVSSLAHQYNMLGGNSPLDYFSPEAKAALQRIDPETYKKVVGITGTSPAPPAVQPKVLTPEEKAQFFDVLQQHGADAADAYLRQFGQRMKDKSAANRPYSQELDQPKPGTFADSYLGQGMSGANEGLAGVLGAPADLMRGAMNLVPKGINAVANTDIPMLPEAFGGGEWWKRRLSDIGSIQAPAAEPSKQFVRRVGESVGAAAVPALGMGGSAAKIGMGLLSGLGGGIGAATAQQIAPGNTLAELAGEVVGGGATGLASLKGVRRAAQRQIEARVPTIDELKSQASGLYQRAETNGAVATPDQTQELATDFRKTLLDEGQLGPGGKITNADTNTNKAHNLIEQYAGQEMKPKEMNTVRTVLADSRKSADPSDQRLGHILLNQFDDFVSPLAPEFDQARDVSSRYLQAQDLEKARELAGARASQFTGSGFENALRTEYRGLDRANIKGQNYFNPDVTDAIQKVARGTPTSNFLRGIGRLAPTGPVAGMGSVVPALTLGSMAGPAAGGALGGGLAGAGILGRIGATRMGINAADQAELIARNGGALEQAPLLPKSLADFVAYLAASQAPKYANRNSPKR